MIARKDYLEKLRLLKDQNLIKVITGIRRSRELAAFRNIRDGYPKYLLTMDFDTTNINGIKKINVIDWLLS